MRHTIIGIGPISRIGATVTREIFCGMTIILNGSTPLRRMPRSAASSGVIVQVGSSCSKSFSTTSGHRRHSTSSTSRRSTPSCEISTRAVWSPPISPAKQTVRHRLKRRAVLSRTSLRPRRSRRAASGKPAGDRMRDDGKARCCGRLRPISNARPPSSDHRAATPKAC